MKKIYAKPVTECYSVKVSTAMLAGSGFKTYVRFGLSSEDGYNYYKGSTFFGNDSWINEGYTGVPATPGLDDVLIVGDDNGNMNSRSKGGLWTDDD